MNNTEQSSTTDPINSTPNPPLQKSPTSKERLTTSVKKRPTTDNNQQRINEHYTFLEPNSPIRSAQSRKERELNNTPFHGKVKVVDKHFEKKYPSKIKGDVNCTFHPDIASSLQNYTVEELQEIQRKRAIETQENLERIRKEEQDLCPFRPQISEKSKKLIRSRSAQSGRSNGSTGSVFKDMFLEAKQKQIIKREQEKREKEREEREKRRKRIRPTINYIPPTDYDTMKYKYLELQKEEEEARERRERRLMRSEDFPYLFEEEKRKSVIVVGENSTESSPYKFKKRRSMENGDDDNDDDNDEIEEEYDDDEEGENEEGEEGEEVEKKKKTIVDPDRLYRLACTNRELKREKELAYIQNDQKLYRPVLYKNKNIKIYESFEQRRARSIEKYYEMIEYEGPKERHQSPMKRPSTIKHNEDDENGLSKPPMTTQRSTSVMSKRSYVRNRIDPSLFKPQITEKSRSLSARRYRGKNIINELYEDGLREKPVYVDPEETFSPQVTRKSERYGKNHFQRITESIEQYTQKYREILENNGENPELPEDYTFRPKLSRSVSARERRRSPEKLGQELYEYTNKYNDRLNKRKKEKSEAETKECSFRPRINKNSRSQSTSAGLSKKEYIERLYAWDKTPIVEPPLRDAKELTFHPKINKNYKLDERKGKVGDRLYMLAKRDNTMSYEELKKYRYENDGIDECKPVPTITEYSKKKKCVPLWKRNNDLRVKYAELDKKREEQLHKECSFKPKVDHSNDVIYESQKDRFSLLIKPTDYKSREEKSKELEREKCTFKPKISSESREMIKKKRDAMREENKRRREALKEEREKRNQAEQERMLKLERVQKRVIEWVEKMFLRRQRYRDYIEHLTEIPSNENPFPKLKSPLPERKRVIRQHRSIPSSPIVQKEEEEQLPQPEEEQQQPEEEQQEQQEQIPTQQPVEQQQQQQKPQEEEEEEEVEIIEIEEGDEEEGGEEEGEEGGEEEGEEGEEEEGEEGEEEQEEEGEEEEENKEDLEVVKEEEEEGEGEDEEEAEQEEDKEEGEEVVKEEEQQEQEEEEQQEQEEEQQQEQEEEEQPQIEEENETKDLPDEDEEAPAEEEAEEEEQEEEEKPPEKKQSKKKNTNKPIAKKPVPKKQSVNEKPKPQPYKPSKPSKPVVKQQPAKQTTVAKKPTTVTTNKPKSSIKRKPPAPPQIKTNNKGNKKAPAKPPKVPTPNTTKSKKSNTPQQKKTPMSQKSVKSTPKSARTDNTDDLLFDLDSDDVLNDLSSDEDTKDDDFNRTAKILSDLSSENTSQMTGSIGGADAAILSDDDDDLNEDDI